MKDLSTLARRPVEVLLKDLRAASNQTSAEAGMNLTREAKDFGLTLREFLTFAIDPLQGDSAPAHAAAKMSGYEAALSYLVLPTRDDLSGGVMLQAASDTFQTFPGTRALFPEVVDDMLRWNARQDGLETLAPLISQSRNIAGNEMISTVVLDETNERGSFTVPELANIPVRTIRLSETAVKMYKHGSAIRTSYEFNRRARLDVLTPYAARVAREKELSKVRAATLLALNGDGVNAAATVETITSHGGTVNNLSANYKALAKFLMKMAKDGVPADVVVGNYDMFVELMFMFSQTLPSGVSQAEKIASVGGPVVNLSLPIMNNSLTFALSSQMPAGRLLAYNRGETMEELVETGSSIAESQTAILNQSITYVRSEVSGFRLTYGDTRRVLDTTA
jgi:hypothetical protein